MSSQLSRRSILRTTGLGALGLGVSRYGRAWAVPPSDRLTVACIGVGSQGLRVLLDMLRLPEVQVMAVCDVNRGSTDYLEWGPGELRTKVRATLQDSSWGASNAGPAAGREVAQGIVNAFYAKERNKPGYSGCAAYEDYRDLLAKEHGLDAVVVSTPDHWHATIAIAAMRAGKHVYSQKPMAHSVWESREMPRVAEETKRAAAVSIFNAHAPASEQVREAITGGAVGAVHQVDIWTTRASSFWKQGLPTPAMADPVPPSLNWNLWLGPAAARPYSHVYQPFVWRAWYDFGCGALGDMGEYGFDTIYRALGLGVPEQISASSSELFPDCFPVASAVQFRYGATGGKPAVALNWFDGGMQPARPMELPASVPMLSEGVIYHGEKGKLLTEYMGQHARVLTPDGRLTELHPKEASGDVPYQTARPELGPGAAGAVTEHYLDWIRACQGGPAPRTSYAFEQPIVETLMLGVIAQRTHEVLRWDAAGMKFVQGSERATALVKPTMRAPFAV
ncbi:Gfo/Idh/MocA family oxidoreductase [Terriglobus sp.]|uniref:Gfo/Idh/MocA family oxidoreductase n=1 Tax=Terriglobus sp. TaxID=1889013 RepID=UPI003B00D1AC